MSERWNDVTELQAIREDYLPQDDYNCKRCDGTGQIDRELLADYAVSVERCPDCGGRGAA